MITEKRREVIRKAQKRFREKYPEKNNDKVRRSHLRLRLKLFNILGDIKCSNPQCLVSGGCIDIRCLQLDHVNGGGYSEFKKHGPIPLYRYYSKHPEEAKKNLQILCANCNWIKRIGTIYDKLLQ